MTGGEDSSDDEPDHRPLGAERTWQHPSEVGLATRGHVDRRRSTVVAAGVVLGGLGLLVSSVLLGSMDDDEPPAPPLVQHATTAVASVTVRESDGSTSTSTGLVLDDDGHVLVHGSDLDDASEIWARCNGHDQQVEVVGTDPSTDLTVLRLPTPAGVPASVADVAPSVGEQLTLISGSSGQVSTAGTADVGRDRVVLAGTDAEPVTFAAVLDEDAPAIAGGGDGERDDATGSMVFDPAGRFVGIVESIESADPRRVEVLWGPRAVAAADTVLGARS